MTKTLLNMIQPVLEQTGLSDSDLLARLNAIRDAMVDNPSFVNPPVDMTGFEAAIDRYAAAVSAVAYGAETAILDRDKRRAGVLRILRLLGQAVGLSCEDAVRQRKSLSEASPFVDTVATISTAQPRSPSLRLPPLVCSTKGGDRYVRPRQIQDEIRRILPMSRPDCMAQAKNLQNETLVFFIRLTHESDDEVCGSLTEELRKRIRVRTRPFCGELDDYDQEQLVLNVEIQVLELVFTKERFPEQEILEVAFGRAVRRLARDEFEKFKNSTAGNIVDITVDSTDEEWEGEEEVERPIEFLPDGTSGPEEILLNLDMNTHRHRLLSKALDAVADPRHREAAILHWAHGIPVDSCQRGQQCLTRRFRKGARQIKYWLATAMKEMRGALGIQKSGENRNRKRFGERLNPAACLSTFIGAAGINISKAKQVQL